MLRLNEHQVTRQCVDLLRAYGWLCLRLESELVVGRGGKSKLLGEAGLPDWVVLKPVSNGLCRVLFLEMKSQNGRLRASQRCWHSSATARGYVVGVVRSLEDLKQLMKDLHFDAP